MELDNKPQVSRAKLLLITLPFVLLLCCSVPALFLLINTWIPTFIAGALVLIGWVAAYAFRLTAIRFKFTDARISVFYNPINPMTSSFRRIEIATEMLEKYEIRVSWGGWKKELILHENLDGQIAIYPPVSLTLCDEDTISKIEQELRKRIHLG